MVLLTALLMLLTASIAINKAIAQAPITLPNNTEVEKEDLFASIDVASLKSTVFTYAEHLEIKRARRAVGRVASPTKSGRSFADGYRPPPETRYIHLQGILYTAPGDWIMWLNGKKYNPTALPQEALGIEVYSDYIEIKWYDDFTNQIFPIRLKPLQKFNLDTRIFLPG